MKKVYIISTSLRNNSNSEILAHCFEKGAIDNNNEVKFLSLKNFDLKFCLGCLSCVKTNKCVIKDDMVKIIDDISNSDVICFATPIYYYSLSGQLKTFLDRLNPLYGKENKFKEIYLLASCADESISAFEKAKVTLSGWTECFDGVYLKDSLLALNSDVPSSVKEEYKDLAYKMGNSIL